MRRTTLAESLYLAAHAEYTDRLLVHRGALSAGLAGGWLCEAMLAGRVGVRAGRLVVVDTRPTDDPSSAAVLAALSGAPVDALGCVDRLTGDAYETVRDGLLAAGVLDRVRVRRMGVLPAERWRPVDPTVPVRVVTRMRHVALTEALDDGWTATLCALVHTVRLWPALVPDSGEEQVGAWLSRALADYRDTLGIVLSAVDTAVVRTAVGFGR